jgi:hypothetical protein
MSCKKYFVALAALIAAMGFVQGELRAANPASRTPSPTEPPPPTPQLSSSATFKVSTIEISNGKIAPSAAVEVPASGSGGATTPSGASSVALSVGITTTTTTIGKDLSNAGKALSVSPAATGQNTAEAAISGTLTWSGSTATIAPIADSVTADLLPAMSLSGSATGSNGVKTLRSTDFTLTLVSGSVVTLTCRDQSVSSGTATLTYRYATKPWSIIKYVLTPSTSTQLALYPLDPYDLTAWVSYTLSSSGMSTSATGAPSNSPGAAANVLQNIPFIFNDQSTKLCRLATPQVGQTIFIVKVPPVLRDKPPSIFAGKVQLVTLPAPKDWPLAGSSSFQEPSTGEWLFFNNAGQDLQPGAVEIYRDPCGEGSPMFSTTFSSKLTSGGSNAIAQFSSAVKSGGSLPASVVTVPVGQASTVSVTAESNNPIGLVLGGSSTVTLSGSLSLSAAKSSLPGATSNWQGRGLGTLSVSGTGTPRMFEIGEDPDQRTFELSSGGTSTIYLNLTQEAMQSVAGAIAPNGSQLTFNNFPNTWVGSGALLVGRSSARVSELRAPAAEKMLNLSSANCTVTWNCGPPEKPLEATLNGSLSTSGSSVQSVQYALPLTAIAPDLCKPEALSLSGSSHGSWSTQDSPLGTWRIDTAGDARYVCSPAPSGSFNLRLSASAPLVSEAGDVSRKFLGATTSLPLEWNGEASLTLGSGTAILIASGPATAAVSLASTRSSVFTVGQLKPDNAKWLFQIANSGQSAPATLVLAPTDSRVPVIETIVSAVIDVADAQQLAKLHLAMAHALQDVVGAKARLAVLQARLTVLQGDPHIDPADSEVVELTSKLEQATGKYGQLEKAYKEAKYRFDHLLNQAEDSGATVAPTSR